MATTNYTLTNIAIKRVSGKAQVSINNNVNQELIGSSVQSSNSTVFGETVPNAPAQTLYLVQSASVSDPGTAMYVEFNVYPIGDSKYANDPVAAGSDDEGDVTTNTHHAYALYLSSAFDDEVVDFDTHASTGTSFGSFPFVGGSYLTGSAGKFQLIPSFLSTDTSTNNSYIPTLYSNEGAEMQASDPSDWYLDPFSGILFIQDPTQYGTPNGDGSSPNTSTSIPGKIRAFIYVGKYQDEVTFGAGDVNFIVSGSDDGFAAGNDDTINFISGSAGITVVNDGTDTITIGASTDNITVNQITASIINADTIEASEYIVSSSVTYMTQSFSEGSTIFGDTLDDTHQFTGSLFITGGDTKITFDGEDNKITTTHTAGPGEGSLDIIPGGNLNLGLTQTNKIYIGRNDDSVVTYETVLYDGTTTKALSISASNGATFGVPVTASSTISASSFVSASDLYLTDTLTALDGGVTVTANSSVELEVDGNITASGDISASGLFFASASDDGGSVGSIAVAMYDTASGRLYYTSSNALGDTTSLEASASAGIFLSASEGTGFSLGLMQSASFTSGSGEGLTVTAGTGNNIEFELVGVLSSSQQIATDISGAIDAATGSLLTSYGLLSSSQQIATDISGAIDAATGSLLTDYGLLSGSAQIATDISGAIGAATASLSASIVGTANEVEVVGTLGGNITIGLPDEVTIVSASIGDLVVTGETTQIQVTNLYVEDQFILLNSGAANNTADIGIIAQTSSVQDQGSALYWDAGNARWEIDHAGADAASNTADGDAAIVAVRTDDSATPSDPYMGAVDAGIGQMYIDTGDNDGDGNTIYIYA